MSGTTSLNTYPTLILAKEGDRFTINDNEKDRLTPELRQTVDGCTTQEKVLEFLQSIQNSYTRYEINWRHMNNRAYKGHEGNQQGSRGEWYCHICSWEKLTEFVQARIDAPALSSRKKWSCCGF